MEKLSSLSWEIIKRVIIVHGIVALLLTSIQLWIDYKENLNSIEKNLENSFEMFGLPISEAFYNANSNMIEKIFNGVLNQGDFLAVAVYDRLADDFIIRGDVDIDINKLKPYMKNNHLQFSIEGIDNILIYQHPIKITTVVNEERYFGNMVVFSSKELAFQRIENTILIVFFNSVVKAIVLVTMFIWIFNHLLIQPLRKIDNVMANLSLNNLKSNRLELTNTNSKELYKLQTRFNKLLDDLYEAHEKEKLLQQKSKFIEIGEMVGNIAHQWRQPLSAINMKVAIVMEKQLNRTLNDTSLEKKLQEIENLTEYMSETIEGFLKFFNPNKPIQTFKIDKCVESALEILKGKIEKESINIISTIPKNLTIKTTEQDLIQVLLVLLSNSIDAISEKENSENKTIEITVESNENLIISIKDYGKGIKEEMIDRVFEPYFTQKHKAQGVGLGLYIAKMIVEKSLKGTISLQRHKDGTIAIISFPL